MGEKPPLGLTLTEGSVSALFQLVSSGDKEFTAHMDVSTWRPHAPSSPHFRAMGPKSSRQPQACLLDLCRPLPSSILKRQTCSVAQGQLSRCEWGWILDVEAEVVSRSPSQWTGAEAGERGEVGTALLTPPCFLMELQESRRSKFRPTHQTIMVVYCQDRRTGTFCFTMCSLDLCILSN